MTIAFSQKRGSGFMYGVSDEKYIPVKYIEKHAIHSLVPTCVIPDCLRGQVKVDLNAISIVFHSTPEKLVVLAALAVDKLPLPDVYSWSSLDVARWIKRLGFPEYRETFQVNCVCGSNLMLVNAKALIAMNIKNFDHIKKITAEIRCLYQMEKLKNFPEKERTFTPYEHFKFYRHKTGNRYQNIKPSKFFWDKELLDEQPRTLTHWDKLNAWMKREPLVKQKIVIPNLPRRNLYKCKAVKEEEEKSREFDSYDCTCFPPCLCNWQEEEKKVADRFTCLKDEVLVEPDETIDTLSCLQHVYPGRYTFRPISFADSIKGGNRIPKTCPCKTTDTIPYYSVIKVGLFGQKVTKVPMHRDKNKLYTQAIKTHEGQNYRNEKLYSSSSIF
ncbi:uncharacterized protein LOC119669214 [Teleopsis dalmanni]|uniref:uncharacterized protein LOC119669214 n=1 Tax=Teleopsis dalmanni TaxID=139649 RepID=UPI0018CE6623|nr:uncharacterized protein LOC119669214 [Teleopsis dalmanni]